MKRIIFLTVFASLFTTKLFAQEENIPVPEFINSIYAISNNNLLSLENQDAKFDIKTKYRFVSISSSGSYKFNKSKSNIRFTSNTIRLIYEPQANLLVASTDPGQSLKVVKLFTDDKNNSRIYNLTDINISVLGSKSNKKADNQVIPFNYKKYKEKYIIIELKDLEPGEYGLYTISPMKMQLFGIYL
jgi:hypothetical protein